MMTIAAFMYKHPDMPCARIAMDGKYCVGGRIKVERLARHNCTAGDRGVGVDH